MKNGWLRTRKGGPGHPGHTWCGLTYDPRIKAAVWFSYWPPYRLDVKLKAIGAKRSDLYKGPPVWAFYPFEKKWEPMPTAKPWAKIAAAASLESVPALGGSLWQRGGGTWLLDAEKKTWKALPGSKTGVPGEALICHDPGRNIMIAHRGGPEKSVKNSKGKWTRIMTGKARTWHYSVKGGGKSGWVKTAEGEGLPNGHDARSSMYFDPVGKVALLYVRRTRKLWSYEPDSGKWTKLSPKGDAPPKSSWVLAYHDPARNAFVVIGGNQAWCYRFKRRDGKGEEGAAVKEAAVTAKEAVGGRVLFRESFDGKASDRQLGRFLRNKYIALAKGAGPDGSNAIRVTYAGYARGSQRVIVRCPLRAATRRADLSFDVLFEKGFDFVLGGKLHGLGPENPITGGRARRPEGWSARMMFRGGGRIAPYLYDQDKKKKWGIGTKTKDPVFVPGRWYHVELKVVLNTPGKPDGSARVLIDGKEVTGNDGVVFRGAGGPGTLIRTYMFSTFHGGGTPKYAPVDKDGKFRKVHALYDNFKVVEGAPPPSAVAKRR